MARKQPKSSGLDIEGMMNDIDNQDELKKESEDLSKQLQEIHSAIEQQKFLLRDMQFMTESLEQISKKLDHGAEINKEILGDIQVFLFEIADGFPAFTAFLFKFGLFLFKGFYVIIYLFKF